MGKAATVAGWVAVGWLYCASILGFVWFLIPPACALVAFLVVGAPDRAWAGLMTAVGGVGPALLALAFFASEEFSLRLAASGLLLSVVAVIGARRIVAPPGE